MPYDHDKIHQQQYQSVVTQVITSNFCWIAAVSVLSMLLFTTSGWVFMLVYSILSIISILFIVQSAIDFASNKFTQETMTRKLKQAQEFLENPKKVIILLNISAQWPVIPISAFILHSEIHYASITSFALLFILYNFTVIRQLRIWRTIK